MVLQLTRLRHLYSSKSQISSHQILEREVENELLLGKDLCVVAYSTYLRIKYVPTW